MKLQFSAILSIISLAATNSSAQLVDPVEPEGFYLLDAALGCEFETECFETEACSETDFSASLEVSGHGVSNTPTLPVNFSLNATLTNDAETVRLAGTMKDDLYQLHGDSVSGLHLLTITPNDQARYSVHYGDGPLAITYHGTCEETK